MAFSIIAFEMILSVPLYFLGKKYEWIHKNRKKAMFFFALILFVLLLFFVIIFGEGAR